MRLENKLFITGFAIIVLSIFALLLPQPIGRYVAITGVCIGFVVEMSAFVVMHFEYERIVKEFDLRRKFGRK